MQKTEIDLPEIKLVGITVRTKTQDEMDPSTAKISSLVEQYFSNAVANKISNRKSPGKNFIIYCDYESNYTGNYTCFIGEEVTEFGELPAELVTHIIPKQKYIKFTTEKGKTPEIVIKSWTKIWATKELEEIRAYKSDFELYILDSFNPDDASIDIYVGIKSS